MLKKRLYHKVLKRLLKFFKKLLGYKLKGHRLTRLRSLAAFIAGMISNKSSHLAAIGQGLIQLIKAHSQAKAARKFVYNKAIDYDNYYLPYVKELVQLVLPILPSTHSIELVIDGSQMGKNHAVLMISLVFGKRGIPLGWSVKKGSKGHFTKAHHIELIRQVQKDFAGVFPTDRTIMLLGDGEFGSIDAQECCLDDHWDYAFRIACNTILYKEEIPFSPKQIGVASLEDYSSIALEVEQDEEEKKDLPFYLTNQWEWELPDDIQMPVVQNHTFVEDVLFSKKRFGGVHFILWHDPKHKKPVPLISNVADARFVTQAYDKRYSIECLFKDLKSTSFNLHKTRLKDADAISNLIMIAAFAFTLLMELGTLYKKHPVRAYIHQVRPDQVVQSFYTLALGLVEFFLREDIDFEFDELVPIPIPGL